MQPFGEGDMRLPVANRQNKPTVASRGQQNHAAIAGGPSDPQCGSCYGLLYPRRYGSQGRLIPRKGTAKTEKDVWGNRCPSQRMASKAVLDIPITKAKGYQGSRTVMMIKVLLNKFCQSPTSAR